MRLPDLVAAVHASFDPDAALADVVGIARHDRYQASAGIGAAAAMVAERAVAAGLSDVTVHPFPADGLRHWWTYRAPLAWTPVGARLTHAGTALVRYPEMAYTLAAYSAPARVTAPLVRWTALADGSDPRGALVVVDDPRVPVSTVAGRLAALGAAGLVADPLWSRADRLPDQVGRIELPAGTPLVGFSLTRPQLARLAAGADAGGTATVEVTLDPAPVPMPVVTGRLPGDPGAGEILLTAHLCHPRPSANDNASGVAALLGAARVLAGAPAGGPSVRFVWGPEFVGIAAYLHDIAAAPPVLGLNVDMAGEDVHRTGGPMVVERGPDDLPSFLPALAVRCAALLPPAARSYSGALPSDAWHVRETPYAGGSDHALLADEPTRCPTVALGHWPDRTNHSSADTVSTVDPGELRRAGTVVASVVAAVRGRVDHALAADVADAAVAWAGRHLLDALPGRRPHRPPVPDEPVLDPWADGETGRRLDHRRAVVLACVPTLELAGVPAAERDRIAARLDAVAAALSVGFEPASPDGPVPVRGWTGPINLRALAEAAEPADRRWLDGRLAEDRGGNYARVTALLRAIDGVRDRRAIAWHAALASGLPVPIALADHVFDLLDRAGWTRIRTHRTETADALARPA